MIRPATRADAAELDRFYRRLSAESLYSRFFSVSADAHRRCSNDAADHVVLVAEMANEIVAVGEYFSSPARPARAEIAFAVLDRMQHHGFATRLLRKLRVIALQRGIREFTAEVLVTNRAMMDVFRNSGMRLQERLHDGIYDVVLDLDEAHEEPGPTSMPFC